jgi:hypothetical protein
MICKPMKNKLFIALLFVCCLPVLLCAQQVSPRFAITLGSGLGIQYNNSLQQSSSNGTPISVGKYSTSVPLALRLQVNYHMPNNQMIRVLVSPFNESGSFAAIGNTIIQDKQFVNGEMITTHFGFNVLRIGFAKKQTEGRWQNFKLGGTLAIRKWEASFTSASKKAKNDNLIAVPLLFVGYEKNLSAKINWDTELDGLIVPFAYVLEGGSKLNYQLSKKISSGLYYRILSGYYNDADIKNQFTTQSLGINIQLNF